MKTQNNINKNVRLLRLILGLTATEFASRLGVSKQLISSIEIGRAQPSTLFIERVVEAYHIKVGRLASDNFLEV